MEIAAMSPPVSPQRRRDRGSGPTDRGGSSLTAAKQLLDNSAKQKKQQLWLFSNPSGAPRHLPYPRSMRGRGGHCYAPTAAQTSQRVCQLRSSLNP